MRWRAAGHYSRPLGPSFGEPLRGGRLLEVGGPSRVFSEAGLLPVYPSAQSVDGVQWAAATAWHDLDREGGYRPEGERRGELYVVDDPALGAIGDGVYDAVISSHVIEHLANPLLALSAWRRVTRGGGHVLVVAPHKEGTFDHRRPTTSLEHMVDDLQRGTGEDDLTHLQETLELHDRGRDAEAVDREEWERRRRANASTRLLHHHTFTTRSLLSLLDSAGAELLAVEARFPHDIYVLGRWPIGEGKAENGAVLEGPIASPFRADRRRSR
jgi:SAM-dependent methyltransferase